MSRVVVDLTEWTALGAELAEASPERYLDVMERLRHVIDAQRVINAFESPAQHALRPSEWRTKAEAAS